ncbi:hypothetical protein SDRG_07345 [Saprolegnia diclina VS20]|uniref:EF-hand domain-containing protein n=1 Tax=Saprolegnia diclina (strain VS20) TaxID=1156394 RepID=T0RXP7_SAPDV|nr:hypothetical protein SDRG_07345 [Saprolegnia diclina VS20]EQC35112.1 hypothetical protein SDRG_07345 [Saprolegnia diclina VS20]|eukprot:XP_008611396.1 hypothetical protein SDRG_07345 [Saprolegnia diclina VS20]
MLPPTYTSAELGALFHRVAKHVEDLNRRDAVIVRVSVPSDAQIASWIAQTESFQPGKHPISVVGPGPTTEAPGSPTERSPQRSIRRARGSHFTLVAGKQRAIPVSELSMVKAVLRHRSLELAHGRRRSDKEGDDKQKQAPRHRRKAVVASHLSMTKASATAGKQALISELIHATSFTMQDIFQMSCQFKELAMANGTITSDTFSTIIGSHLGKLVAGVNLPSEQGVSSLGETISSSASLIGRLYKVFDKDGNGTIDFREFIIGLNSLVQGSLEQKLDTLFAVYDKDGSGTISVSELVLILNGGQEKMSQLAVYIDNYFATVDTNGDNVITEDEFLTAASVEPLVLEALTKSLAFNRQTGFHVRQSLRCFCERAKLDWAAMLSMLEDVNDSTRLEREAKLLRRRFSSGASGYVAPPAPLSVNQFEHMLASYFHEQLPEDAALLHELSKAYAPTDPHGKLNAREFVGDVAGYLWSLLLDSAHDECCARFYFRFYDYDTDGCITREEKQRRLRELWGDGPRLARHDEAAPGDRYQRRRRAEQRRVPRSGQAHPAPHGVDLHLHLNSIRTINY